MTSLQQQGCIVGDRVCTVAHSILAEVSLGISQMKFSRPPSWYRGMSCHVEMSWPALPHTLLPK